MRILLLSALAFILASCAAPSPRYTLLAEKSIPIKRTAAPAAKAPQAVKPAKPQRKPALITEKPAENVILQTQTVQVVSKSKFPLSKKKYIVTTIMPEPDTSLFADDPFSTVPPAELRNCAARLVLLDIPVSKKFPDETQTDTIPIDSLIADTSDTNDIEPYDVDVTIDDGDIVGFASWYGPGLQGKKTSSGERFDMNKMTAAHRVLPFGTIVQVTNLSTGKSVKVRINDRGPHRKDRMIDLSKKAAQKIGVTAEGYAKVKMRVIK